MRLYVGAQDSHKVLLNELDNLPPTRRAEVVAKQQDRLENISFTAPGRYLVICGVKVHFEPAPRQFVMFGFVDVEPAEN